MKTISKLLATTLFVLWAPVAQAQDFYGGVALDYHTPHAGEAHTGGAILAGVTWGAGPLGYGAEVDYATPIDDTDTYDAMRLRGLIRYDFGAFTGIAGVGATRYTLNGTDLNGYNFGLGAEVGVSDALSLRVEIIRDMMDEEYTTNVTATRLGLIYRF